MGRRFLITGTDTGVGKTMVGCALAFAFKARGLRVGVMKPAETGCAVVGGALEPADALALKLAAGSDLSLELVCPFRYRAALAPAAAAEAEAAQPPDLGTILERLGEIAQASDVILVEGAGGITVPLTWGTNYADLALAAGLEVIVVIANRLGCLNAAVLTLEYAAQRRLSIAGYILNDVEPAETEAARNNADSIRRLTSARSLGAVRHKEPVGLSIIEQLR